MTWHRGLIGVAAVGVVLVAILGASVFGDRSRLFGVGISRTEAAAAFGVPGDAVVMVGGDAVGLRVTGDASSSRLELLLMAADEREVRQVYEHTLTFEHSSIGTFIQPVRCLGVLERDIYAVIGMGWPADRERVGMGMSGVAGEGAVFPVRGPGVEDRVAVLFVAPADDVDDDSVLLLDIGAPPGAPVIRMGVRGPLPDRGPLREYTGLGPDTGPLGPDTGPLGPDGVVNCAHPATARCGDWAQWEEGTRASMTKWLTERNLEAVRIPQQLPEDATDAELVEAAVSSIDKICQGSPPDTRLTDIVERLYD